MTPLDTDIPLAGLREEEQLALPIKASMNRSPCFLQELDTRPLSLLFFYSHIMAQLVISTLLASLTSVTEMFDMVRLVKEASSV